MACDVKPTHTLRNLVEAAASSPPRRRVNGSLLEQRQNLPFTIT